MNKYIHPLGQHYVTNPLPKQATKMTHNNAFKDVLTQYTDLKVSKHAKVRLEERNIQINEQKWQQISNKMVEAKQKGVTDALVVLEDAALLVSTKNNTVITALNQAEATEKIFTNINGTILI